MKIRTAPTGPEIEGTQAGEVLAWNGTGWQPAALPAPLPEDLQFDGPKDGDQSSSTTYVGTASVGFEVPDTQVFRIAASGVILADTLLERIEWRIQNTTLGTTVVGPVRSEIALTSPGGTPLEEVLVSAFSFLIGPLAFATYELQFRRAAGLGTATAQDMCLQAHRIG